METQICRSTQFSVGSSEFQNVIHKSYEKEPYFILVLINLMKKQPPE